MLAKRTPEDISGLLNLADHLADAGGFLPDHIKSKGQLVATILAGQELGLGPMASLRGISLIRGKVVMDYSLQVGLLRQSGYRVEWPKHGPTYATLRLTAPDGSVHEETWSEERARRAGLWGQRGPWTQYPEAMLRARCVSSAARSFAADVLAGVYVPGELPADREPERVTLRQYFDHTHEEEPEASYEPLDRADVPVAPLQSTDDPEVTAAAKAIDDELMAWCREFQGTHEHWLKGFHDAEPFDTEQKREEAMNALMQWFQAHHGDLRSLRKTPRQAVGSWIRKAVCVVGHLSMSEANAVIREWADAAQKESGE